MRVRLSRVAVVFGICLPLAVFCKSQDRFESGKYKGFTKYSALAIVELREPFIVREAKGIIQYPNGNGFLPNVLVEIRNSSGTIKATKTDSQGRFKFRGLREGTYMLKTTLSGFQSVVGTVLLQKNAKKSEEIKIEMPLGV
jgi:hypothetical protein